LGWVALAQKLASNIEGEEHLRKLNSGNATASSGQGNSSSNRGNGTGNANPGAGNPMDLDAIRVAVAKLDSAERTRRLSEGRCLHCGKVGHIMRDCKSRANTYRGDRGGRRGNHGQQQQSRGGYSHPNQGYQGYNSYPQQTPNQFGNQSGSPQY
jgi:hypothetical protein